MMDMLQRKTIKPPRRSKKAIWLARSITEEITRNKFETVLRSKVVSQLMMQYAIEKRADRVKETIDRFHVDFGQTDSKGNNLIIIATLHADLHLLSILTKHPFDINHQNLEGNTALHFACSMSKKKVIDILLLNGANEDIANDEGFTAWELFPQN